MSNIFKAIKNLTKPSQKLQDAVKTATDNTLSKNSSAPSTHDMAAQVILNNGLKVPRIGRKYNSIHTHLELTSPASMRANHVVILFYQWEHSASKTSPPA